MRDPGRITLARLHPYAEVPLDTRGLGIGQAAVRKHGRYRKPHEEVDVEKPAKQVVPELRPQDDSQPGEEVEENSWCESTYHDKKTTTVELRNERGRARVEQHSSRDTSCS